MIVPVKLRMQVLETIHAAHQGVSGMISRVEESVFWPGITTDIIKTRNTCLTCIKEAPSQPAGTPTPPPVPAFPFQYIVADYCSVGGRNFLVIGDRFSGWLSIYEAGEGAFDAKSLVTQLRNWCQIFNIPEEISTDGGTQMTSSLFQDSLRAWGIRHRLSSAYYAHSNCRAELAVKAGKRILRDNIGPDGSIDNDKFMRAAMQFRNTPMQDCRRSPAQMVFGRQLRDFLPSLLHKFAPNPTKWDKTGVVLENKPNSQVLVRVDGSRRTTLRNRRFVRPLDPDVRRHASRNTGETPVAVPRQDDCDDRVEKNFYQNEDYASVVRDENSEENQNNNNSHVRDHPVIEETVPEVMGNSNVDNADGDDVQEYATVEEHVEPRPKRVKKPNKKYDPDIYDLSYVSQRRKSRKSVKRAVYGGKDA